MADRLDFLNGVTKLHGFYTEQVRMLAHAYDLTPEEAAMLLDQYGYHNVARAILVPPPSDEQNDTDIRQARN
uniref:hypothetical protein n=1 Tax=Vaginimicrobium propionicum TaxID=1871034 RepID=UPI00097040FE|nr:hypothetical protein [Vaginimicrobium propionicum]